MDENKAAKSFGESIGEIQDKLNTPAALAIRSTAVAAAAAAGSAAGAKAGIALGTVAAAADEFITFGNSLRLSYLLKGLAAGKDPEKQVEKFRRYIEENQEHAQQAEGMLRKALLAESERVSCLYGLILAEHLDEQPYSNNELIVCRALVNATDYDIWIFQNIMNSYLTDKQPPEVKIPASVPQADDYISTCDWCVYNRIFSGSLGWHDFGNEDEKESWLTYSPMKPAYILNDYLTRLDKFMSY